MANPNKCQSHSQLFLVFGARLCQMATCSPSPRKVVSLTTSTSCFRGIGLVGIEFEDCTLHDSDRDGFFFFNECGIYKMVKVVHGNWSNNHCTWSELY